jgi:CheY-like chemotaxis protein
MQRWRAFARFAVMEQQKWKTAMQEQETTPYGLDRRSRFLLVVDSDANNRYYLSMVLQRLEYHISTAMSGEEALAIAAVAPPALIITALDIKGMNGLDLIQQLAQVVTSPIIAIRKQGDLLGEKRSLALGAGACLSSPISLEQLYQAVQAAIETTPRANIRIRASLSVGVNEQPLDGRPGPHAVVLSERGMFLPTGNPASVDTRLSLQIELNNHWIEVEAVTLYSHRTTGGPYQEPGMGVEFTRIAAKDQERIRQFIRNEVTRGIMPLND